MKCAICNGTGIEKTFLDSVGIYYEERDCRGCNGSGIAVPRILNKHSHGIPKDAVYIGRGSKWGNPFKIGIDGDRDEVIAKYEKWFIEDPSRVNEAKIELRGKNLVCYCAPQKCHGDFLLKLANEEVL
ncbi:MAG: DUF4326 domain-containing protein [Ignavibacteria bacterium]|jgi:hypothetical protein